MFTPPKLQYPLLTGTGITSAFGPRGGRLHEGDDIFPGYGTPIYSIAAGVVIKATGAGAYGNHVVVEHVIDGQMVTSLYAHMAPGTMTVSVGQQVGSDSNSARWAKPAVRMAPTCTSKFDRAVALLSPPYAWLAARI